MKQHKDDEKLELSDPKLNHATAEHSLKTGHMIAYDFAEIIDHGKPNGELHIREALAIRQHNCGPSKGLNKDFGKPISDSWLALTPKIKYHPKKIFQ